MSERLIPFGKINENYSLFHRLWVHREEWGGGVLPQSPIQSPSLILSLRKMGNLWGSSLNLVKTKRAKRKTLTTKKGRNTSERGQKLFMCLERVCTLTRSASICNPPCGHMCVCVGAHPCVWVWNVTRIKLLPMLNCHSARKGSWRQKRLGWVPETTLVKRP